MRMEFEEFKPMMVKLEAKYRATQINEFRARGTARSYLFQGALAAAHHVLRLTDEIKVEWPRGDPLTPYEEKLLRRGLARMKERERISRLQRKYDVAQH